MYHKQDGQCACSVTLRRVCVLLAFGIQHAMRMLHIVICGLFRSKVFFHIFLINGTIFEKKFLNSKCVFSFSLRRLSEIFLILRRNERDMIKNVCWSSCKVPVIPVRF
jgi:hypothetical protein